MDLNKKVSFACNKSQLELLENYNREDADFVDCDRFWEKVKLAMGKGQTCHGPVVCSLS